MGVLNVTPDSFSDGGHYYSLQAAVDRAHEMAAEGADIIDIGGESSRPGSLPVPLEEERRRVMPVIERLAGNLDVPLSIDTRRSPIAREALDMGVSMVNDISGLRDDARMGALVAGTGCHVVIMHMKGTPKDMQINPTYGDLMGELLSFFSERVDYATACGIGREKIILDPGIGFGKRVKDNFAILKNLGQIADLGYPVLVGPSRKSFIGITLDLPVEERLEGTAAAVTAAVLNGARMVRVHDVKQMKRVATIADAVVREGAAA